MSCPPPQPSCTLDHARESLFLLMRTCERHASSLKAVVDMLNAKTPGEGWLTQVQAETKKGIDFHSEQLSSWKKLDQQVETFLESLRVEADQLALDELAGKEPAQQCIDESDVKFKHPELTQFKLEKQAKILGKYGGKPALGDGLTLPRLPRDSILKATGSPAAREIQYSKVEQQDARHLASVMQFKPTAREPVSQSPWQTEVSGKKGPRVVDESEDAGAASSSIGDSPFANELTAKLLQQRAVVTAACTPPPAFKTSSSGAPGGELAEIFKRRQSLITPTETPSKADAVSPVLPRPAYTPPRGVSLSAVPDLSQILQQRELMKKRASLAATAAASPSEPTTPGSNGVEHTSDNHPGPVSKA